MGRLAIFLAGAVMLAGAGPNAAAVVSPGAKASSGERLTMTLSPQQRGAAIGRFVRRWGPYVQQVYGSDAAGPIADEYASFRSLPLTEAEFRRIESNVAPYMR